MIERSTDTSVRCEMKSTMEIHFDSRRSLEENWLSGRYFHPPPVAINCPLWTGIDAPQQRYNMWKQGRATQEITQRILWEIERERISQGGWITGRETKTEENEKSERPETVPAPNRKSVLASAAWKVKPFKGFSFINATNTERPDLSDRSALSPLSFALTLQISHWEQMGKLESLFLFFLGTQTLITGCMWGGYWRRLYWSCCMSLVTHRTQRKGWKMMQVHERNYKMLA